jgi:hypothetical protein
VPADFTLAGLNRAIQIVMDWQGYHLHEFTVAGRAYGVPDPEYEHAVIDERTIRLRDLGLSAGDHIEYVYDFGDDWQHMLELEGVSECDADDAEPVCLSGECGAPPEDIGGVPRYEEFLLALSDPDHEEHDHVKSWVGRPFEPGRFSAADATQRLQRSFRRRKTTRRT